MLEIGIVPKYGTAGLGRFFPYTGYLGLSPVILAGTVHARLPPLCRPLGVRQVLATVKCIETRTCHSLPGGDVEAVIWEKTKRIWEPAGDAEYEDMGDWEGAFKLAVPIEAARMTASSQTTRDSKIVWKLELTFDHKPIPYVGTRITRSHLINMKSYAAPPSSPPTPQPAIAVPGAMIHVRPPVGAFGPGDTFSLEFDVVPDDPETSVRKGLVQLERRSELLAVQPDMSLAVPKQALEVRKPRQREKRSFFRRSRSTSADTSPSPVSPYEKLEDDLPSPPPTAQTPPTVVRSSVLEINTPDPTVTSSGFSFVATGTVPRRGYKWDAGETGRTRLLATSFELRIRFALKTRKSGSKEVVCPPVPIVLVGASQEDRDAAQASIAAASATKANAGHPAKKRHRSSRRGLYMQEGTIEISDPVVHDTLDTLDPVPRRLSPLPPSPSIAPDTSEAGPSRPRLTARVSTGVKPILVRSQESPASTATQGISFALPPRASNPDSGSLQPPDVTLDSTAPSPTRHGGLNITELIHPDYNPASPFSPKPSETSHTLNFAPFDSRSASFPHIGRRISDTQSEEEETQPSRSRQKRSIVGHQTNGSPTNFLWSNPDIKMTVTPATGVLPSSAVIPQPPDSSVPRPSLPSLDALGLGLPKVPEYDRTPRPRTAPSVSIFPNSAWNNVRNTTDSDAPRPVTSAGFGLGLHGVGSSVNLALVDPLSPSTTTYETGQGRLGVFANSSGMSSDTSFGSTRGLLPHHAPAPAYTLSNHAGESTSTIRAPTHAPVNASQRTITSVVPVPPPQRYEGYRVGAGSFAPAISQQQQQQAAMAAEEQRQGQAGEAPPPARRRSSVFGLGGRSFGRTEEGSFAFGLKG